jgi:hypothetical protein
MIFPRTDRRQRQVDDDRIGAAARKRERDGFVPNSALLPPHGRNRGRRIRERDADEAGLRTSRR